MKKLLFVIPEYSHGGTNKSLENMLSLIDKMKYQISMYCLYEDGGEYYKKIFAPYILKKSRLYYWMHDNEWTRKVMGLYNKLTNRNNFGWLYKREVRWLQKKNAFDVVIGFQEGTATEFTSYFKDNIKRIAWIHCDYGAWSKGIRRKVDERYYSNIDDIVCVSETAKKSFSSLFPEFHDRTRVINNVMDVKNIFQLSAIEKVYEHLENDTFRIVSIGRLSGVKQFEKIPGIVNEMKMSVHRPFRWYIIGSGASDELIQKEIMRYNLQDSVILLGAKDNPYPYIKQADLLICTSVSESYPTVINEAKILHVPVLSTNFPSVKEVLDASCGWICNINDMPQLLTRIINNENGEYDKKKASVLKYEYSNREILQRLDKLFEN